jgi:hypothetical protein
MLIFEEHFQDNRHNWFTTDSDECTIALEANYYAFEHKRSGDSWLTSKSADFFYDKKEFRIYVVLEKVTGLSHQGYGLVWGLLDTSNFFEFVICDTGCYRISQYTCISAIAPNNPKKPPNMTPC